MNKREQKASHTACPEMADLLVDWSDDLLSDAERLAVQEHVNACDGCRAELRRLDRSLARLREPIAEPFSRPSLSLAAGIAAVALAAVLLLALSAAFVGQQPGSPVVAKAPLPASRPEVLSPAAALQQIALLEQQARLQASLDLMPSEPWYAAQRAANERLLTTFSAAIDGQSVRQ